MSLANRMDERAIKAERARKQLYKHREALRRKRESALLDADAHSKETQTLRPNCGRPTHRQMLSTLSQVLKQTWSS